MDSKDKLIAVLTETVETQKEVISKLEYEVKDLSREKLKAMKNVGYYRVKSYEAINHPFKNLWAWIWR